MATSSHHKVSSALSLSATNHVLAFQTIAALLASRVGARFSLRSLKPDMVDGGGVVNEGGRGG